jgi:hypothetical protein
VLQVDAFRIAFALSLAIAAADLAWAWFGRPSRRALFGVAALLGLGALAGWIVFALDGKTEVAVAAGGMTASFLAALGALGVQRGVVHSHSVESEIRLAEERLRGVVARATEEQSAEVERTLARSRAESLSLIADQERQIAEERREAIAEHERKADADLREALGESQRRVEQRLADWSKDLERAQANLFEQLQRLAERQRRLIEEAEARLGVDAERLQSESEDQRAALVKLRHEVERATEESIASASSELETHSAERRQALNELSDRLQRRERELREALDREQNEAIHSIQTTFTDVERRLVERLERVVDRTTAQHADAAATQFAEAIKRSREDSAQRLSRELERAVESFTREADSRIAERVTDVEQIAAQRVERRLGDADSAIATRRDELVQAVEQRLAAAERDLRLRLDELAADADAQRAIIEARLFELQRRLDSSLAHAQALDA